MNISPYFKIIAAAVIFGSSGAFVKYLTLPVGVITFFRMAIPAVLLYLYFVITRHRIPWRGSSVMLVASLLNALRLYFYFMGYTYTTIGKAVILLYTWPIFAMLFGMIILKEKINTRKLVLMLTAFSGVVLIYNGKDAGMKSDEYLGLAAITFSAMIYSITVVLFKKESVRFSSWETVFFQNLLGTFIYFPFLFLVDYQMQVNQALAVATYGLLIGLAGFGLFFSSLQDLKASTVSFLNYIEVVSAITLGIIFFNEKPTMEMFMGGALIIAAATLVQKE